MRKLLSVIISLIICLTILIPTRAAAQSPGICLDGPIHSAAAVALANVPAVDNLPSPPTARQLPEKLTLHGDTRIDNYNWLRDENNPQVKEYLEAENKYTQAIMQESQLLQENIYAEMLQYLQESSVSPPIKIGDYLYYTRLEGGLDYPLVCRKKDHPQAAEEMLLNLNLIAKDHPYLQMGSMGISRDQSKLAYTLDTSGDETYTLYIKDLDTGKTLPDKITGTDAAIYWSDDGQTLFYTRLDKDGRPYQVYGHHPGYNSSRDRLIYHEKDEDFCITTEISNDSKYLLINCSSIYSSEVLYLSSDLQSQPRVIVPRQSGIFYSAQHLDDSFILLTNHHAPNGKLVKAPEANPELSNWKDILPHREDVIIEDFLVCQDYLIVQELRNGIQKVRISNWTTGDTHYVNFPESMYNITLGSGSWFYENSFCYYFSSFKTPNSIYYYDIEGRYSLLIDKLILNGYDSSRYNCERLYATAGDGSAIPISLLYKKDLVLDGSNPLLLEGYGAYGISLPTQFDPTLIPLLDRGLIYAIAHVRGGGEKGLDWYMDGTLLKKKNSFTDFISCAEFLIEKNYTRSDKLAIIGSSAGGLLVGSVVNMRPDLCKVAVARVPFVDALTSLYDKSQPFLSFQQSEWGDPNYKNYYDYIKSYSPYDNVVSQSYPHMLITAGINDPRVPYWEPAKWTAKLREYKTDQNILLLNTDMSSGHFGSPGRYEGLKDTAFIYAFIIKYLNLE